MIRIPSLLAVGTALLALHGVAAAAPRPIDLEDFHQYAVVAEPVFSPDGQSVTYSVSQDVVADDAATSDLWTVPWKGGAPRNLTRTPGSSEWQPHYSTDGRVLFFLSDAGKARGKRSDDEPQTQLWRMSAHGGSPRRVTNLPGGISDFSVSPDGRRAVVVAEVGRAVGSQAKNPPPIETERFYFKQDGRGYLDDRTQQLFIVDVKSGEARQLTNGQRDHWQPVWSPDGQWIAYTAKDQGETDRDLNYDVYVQSPDGGAPRRLSDSPNADNDPDWGARPAWSPDSRRLVWLEAGEDKWIYYSSVQLAVADLATGVVTRPARIDRWFYLPRFAPDGSLLTLIEQDRDTYLARVDPASGAIQYLTEGRRFGSDFAVAPDGRIALLESDPARPAELVALGESRRLTNHNAWVDERALGEVRDVAFRSGDVEIHGYVTLPPDAQATQRHPLVVDLHGGPVYQHSHEFNLEARLYAAAGYAVLAVNPRGSSGRGFDFSRAIYADWGNLDAKDISAGISHLIENGIADPDRIGVVGWSYGGILTDYMIASDPRIRAAVSGAGVANVLATFGVDMYAREYLLELGTPWDNFDVWRKLAYPFLEADRANVPTLFQCATADDNVPCVGAQQMYLKLKTRGVPTRLIAYPGENHGLVVPSYLVHRMRSNIDWFNQWLLGERRYVPAAPVAGH